MGKSKRVKNDFKVKNGKAKKRDRSMFVTSLVLILVLVFVVGFMVSGVISSNGIILRTRKTMSSEHFVVNGAMMTYFFNVQYGNFINNYSSYLSTLGLDRNIPLKNQTLSSTAQSYLGGFSGTWFDYFMDQTKSQVKNILIFCEEAKARGIELDDEDRESIKAQMASLKTAAATAAANGYTYNSYLSLTFGSGVKERDIRKSIELSTLAAKMPVGYRKRTACPCHRGQNYRGARRKS